MEEVLKEDRKFFVDLGHSASFVKETLIWLKIVHKTEEVEDIIIIEETVLDLIQEDVMVDLNHLDLGQIEEGIVEAIVEVVIEEEIEMLEGRRSMTEEGMSPADQDQQEEIEIDMKLKGDIRERSLLIEMIDDSLDISKVVARRR